MLCCVIFLSPSLHFSYFLKNVWQENYTLANNRHKHIIMQFIFSIIEHLSFPEISHAKRHIYTNQLNKQTNKPS